VGDSRRGAVVKEMSLDTWVMPGNSICGDYVGSMRVHC
jgi:hypothetical protein